MSYIVEEVDIDYVLGLRDGRPNDSSSKIEILKKYLEDTNYEGYECYRSCDKVDNNKYSYKIMVELYDDDATAKLIKEFNVQNYDKSWNYILFWSDL